jgi:hypothetical protein
MSEHLSQATLADYWAGDLATAEQDAADEHLMGCQACTRLSASVAALADALREMIPPVITPEALAKLAARGLRIVENPMQPGERLEAHFPNAADLLLHRLGGLELGAATRVDFTLRVEGTGEVILTIEDAPFDREHGAVLIACQKHFAHLPPDNVAEVRVWNAGGEESVATYGIRHRWESGTVPR